MCLVVRMSLGSFMQGVLWSVCGLLDCFGHSRGKVFGSGEGRGERETRKESVWMSLCKFSFGLSYLQLRCSRDGCMSDSEDGGRPQTRGMDLGHLRPLGWSRPGEGAIS